MATAELPPFGLRTPNRDPFPRLWSADEFRRMEGMNLFEGRTVTLAGGLVIEHRPGDPTPRPFVFTRKEYYALYNRNFFSGQRVQLIGGVILQETPMNPPHATALFKLMVVMFRMFATGYVVRIQMPLDLNQITEPHPDLVVTAGVADDFASKHPTRADLVVEVSDSTYDSDTTLKASLYAAGGVADYWVIDLAHGRVVVLRDPVPAAAEPFGHTYSRVAAYTLGQTVTPLAAPTARIAVDDLLP
jgi:Uma2 family endonuclease